MSKLRMLAKLKAKKKPEHKAAVEGDAPRQRLDRPPRVRRADGGPALSKEREEYATKKDIEAKEHGRNGGRSALITGGALGMLGRGKLRNTALGTIATVGGGSMLADGIDRRTAEQEAKWARSGKAEDGKEDRASGGRVKRADGGTVVTDETKKEGDRLDDKAKKKFWSGIGLISGAGTLGTRAMLSRVPGAKLGTAGAYGLGTAAVKSAQDDREEADRLKGKAVEGKEDRKRGGRVKS